MDVSASHLYQISYTSTSIFQTTQTSTVVEKKKLKQLSRHTAYTLLTHTKRNIHYYIFNPKTTVYKDKELQNNAAIVFQTSSATGKNSKRIHYIEVVTFEIPFQLNTCIKITGIV